LNGELVPIVSLFPWAKERDEAKLRLLIDMDEVICMFLEELCIRYNKEFGASLAPDQLQQYDLTNFVGEEGKLLFQQAGFFDCLQPQRGMPRANNV